jgi:DNA-binding FrmR family transcriptional regulator
MAAKFGAVLGGVRIDRHAADRIEDPALGRGTAIVMNRRTHGCPLALDTLGGYIAVMVKGSKSETIKRFRRIEGQMRGLARMVDDGRYCIDIVTQISAVRAALRRAEEEILREHVAHCVEHAIASGDKSDQRRKVAELMDVMGRAAR